MNTRMIDFWTRLKAWLPDQKGITGLETAIVLIAFVEQLRERGSSGHDSLVEGGRIRLRPILMTVCSTVGGLLPIMWGHGTGSEVMQRIAAPMVGGMITAPLLSLFVLPAAYLLMRRRQLQAQHATKPTGEHP